MNDIRFDTHDQLVVAKLKQLGDGTTAGEYFARALELDATPALLAYCAAGYLQRGGTDDYDIVGLPYVQDMLDAGRGNADVRTVLETLCFGSEYDDLNSSHREGFWNDPNTWDVFDDADTFVAFMLRYAATYQGAPRVLTEDGHNLLETVLVMWRDTQLQYSADICKIEAVAARHLTFIADEYQLRQMIRYARTGQNRREVAKKQAAMACNVAHWGWNVVFQGFVLSQLAANSPEYSSVMRGIYEMFQKRPEWTAATFRWLAEGFWHAYPEYWDFMLVQSSLANTFEFQGWHLMRVGRTLDGVLQVTLEERGPRVIIRHVPGDEELALGDMVLVSREQLKGLTPCNTLGDKVYELTLTPARRPTPEQLANPKDQFIIKKK